MTPDEKHNFSFRLQISHDFEHEQDADAGVKHADEHDLLFNNLQQLIQESFTDQHLPTTVTFHYIGDNEEKKYINDSQDLAKSLAWHMTQHSPHPLCLTIEE